ncbi:hypothetical protein B0I35DRAFT_358530 [Stachybotrys elegans]|uniref:Ketoreductase domain-containing protein n=1 Tax=Stachybotrys elegans TaxID=80388 RepID=A0A8K0WNN1_9HYPO|nr:hypothetical protein B0I35DRAFT_358530 [Stachybotrys elegans]
MIAPFPSPFSIWHNAPYPAIDPTSPQLSANHKVVVVTGGGIGIGKAVAEAFAIAGAPCIAILGRRKHILDATTTELQSRFPRLRVYAGVADVTDQAAIEDHFSHIARHFGKIDVLVNNAGYQPDLASIKDTQLDTLWRTYEVNVKGSIIVTKAFLQHANAKAVLINFSTGVAHLPFMPGMAAYGTSKLGAAKFFEYVQAENPDLQVINIHPGVIVTEMQQTTIKAGVILPYDDIMLPAGFTVWAATADAAFLKGKLVWCNWDIEELKEKKNDLETTRFLALGLQGYPEK